jgi:hypothetical protein
MQLAYPTALTFAFVIATLGAPAWSADDASRMAGAASAPVTKSMSGMVHPDMARMDSQMKAMNEMHAKMLAAKTPQERDVLAGEHMKLMQASMSVIDSMSPGTMGAQRGDMVARQQTMEMRMELMRGTMQMMMDRLLAAPAK